jgi:hypothetical protein
VKLFSSTPTTTPNDDCLSFTWQIFHFSIGANSLHHLLWIAFGVANPGNLEFFRKALR